MIAAIVLSLLGLGFVLAEVFFPSLGLLGLIAGVLIVGAVVMAFGEGMALGWTFVGAQVVLVPSVVWLGFKALPHLPFGRRMILEGPVATDQGAALPDHDGLAGRSGTALTDLRPVGTADVDGNRLSVVAVGGMIDSGTPIVVVSVEGNEVRVRPAAPDPHATA
jgi:membrane-bound serine protease (ClpP class)